MSMTPYTGETLTIANIGTTPQERAMDTSEFKMAFSKDFHEFVEWFNDTHKTDFDAVQTEITSHKANTTAHGMPTTSSPLPINKGGTGGVTTDGAFTSLCPFIDNIDKTTAGIFINRWGGSGAGTPPVAGVYGWVLTFNTSASYGSQLFVANDANATTYRRNLREGVWRSWNMMYNTTNITVSTSAPGSALAEGFQHQVY